ncbi:MAG: EAL domain-containing protein [Campylobacterota bacterium]|nr:EAL domain-containing protein [Campylobacterota bacterium]
MDTNIKELKKLCKEFTILFVEDDKDAREELVELFEMLFKKVFVAVNGLEGLELLKNNQCDFVMTDLNMPKMNGIDMLREIRKTDIDIPVLILSAHNEVEYFINIIKLGIDGYIMKPLVPTQIIFELKKITEKLFFRKQTEQYNTNLELEVKERTKDLEKKLYYDSVTNARSRFSFFKEIKNISTPIILLIDIDKFNDINEIYGTDIGTLVLKKFADFLLEFSINRRYMVYRLSGDEFVLLDNIDYIDTEKYEDDLEKLFEEFSDFKVETEDETITFDISIGISTSQSNAFECAKIALDYAKTHKKTHVMYSNAIDKRQEMQVALECKKNIKNAISQNSIVAVYQPIVDKKGQILKHEVLMRLKDSNSDKLISPFFFLDIAVKTRLYKELSFIIIFEALNLLKNSEHTLGINFTYDDIVNNTLIDEIEDFFNASPEIAHRAVFEITESQDIEEYDIVKTFIKRFRRYGVKIAIDDFGSGFSNFEYILEIEPDFLKIDGSLIKDIDSDHKAHILVGSIVEFSHKLGIKVIAEYVHNETVFNILKELNVDEYQGYYFSKPKLLS